MSYCSQGLYLCLGTNLIYIVVSRIYGSCLPICAIQTHYIYLLLIIFILCSYYPYKPFFLRRLFGYYDCITLFANAFCFAVCSYCNRHNTQAVWTFYSFDLSVHTIVSFSRKYEKFIFNLLPLQGREFLCESKLSYVFSLRRLIILCLCWNLIIEHTFTNVNAFSNLFFYLRRLSKFIPIFILNLSFIIIPCF